MVEIFRKLETERLILDYRKYCSEMNDVFTKEELVNHYGHENLLKTQNPLWDSEGNNGIIWHLIEKKSDKIIGAFHLHNINAKLKICKMGYIIANEYKRKGLMFEAVKEILNYMFYELKFRMISANIHENNIPSKKLVEKLGFKLKGSGNNRSHYLFGEGLDLIYAMKGKDWK